MAFVGIDDADDPRLAIYRDLPNRRRPRDRGRFIAEGQFLVQRLVCSSLTTESILCSERRYHEIEALVPSLLPVYVASQSILEDVVGFKFHRGLMACGRRPDNRALSDLAGSVNESRMLVVCPNVGDPTNLAGVIRNCAAFGADGLLLGPGCADPYSRRVVRVSMGAVFQLPLRVTDDLILELQLLQNDRFHRVAAVLSDSATLLDRARRAHRCAVLFGSEGHGLDESWRQQCDELVTLPMCHNTDSLNVATASGVFLYHYTRIAPYGTTSELSVIDDTQKVNLANNDH